MSTDMLSDLLDFVGPYPQAWKPEPGEKLIGTIEGFSSWKVEAYEPYTVVILRTPQDDVWAVHAFHHVLRSLIAKEAPQVGDEVGIKYIGASISKEGRKYHDYRLVVARQPPKDPGPYD